MRAKFANGPYDKQVIALREGQENLSSIILPVTVDTQFGPPVTWKADAVYEYLYGNDYQRVYQFKRIKVHGLH